MLGDQLLELLEQAGRLLHLFLVELRFITLENREDILKVRAKHRVFANDFGQNVQVLVGALGTQGTDQRVELRLGPLLAGRLESGPKFLGLFLVLIRAVFQPAGHDRQFLAERLEVRFSDAWLTAES